MELKFIQAEVTLYTDLSLFQVSSTLLAYKASPRNADKISKTKSFGRFTN